MTNLLSTPTDFTSASWQLVTGINEAASSRNTGPAPDGSTTACTLTDGNPIGVDSVAQRVTVPADTSPYSLGILIPKTSGATSFPAFDIRFGTSSVAEFFSVIVNTDTGVTAIRAGWGTPTTVACIAWNSTYWLLFFTAPNSNESTIDVYLSPAFNTDASGNFNTGAEGSAVVYEAYLEQASQSSLAVPQAAFTISGSGASRTFTDTTAPEATSWAWTFGDGGTSSAQNPSHTYTRNGTFTVTLTATNAYGSTSTSQSVTVTGIGPPVASFMAAPPVVQVGSPMGFTDTSGNNPTAWSWTFGDGGSSSAQNPSHVFAQPGVYTVTLVASSSSGASTPFSVQVTVLAAPSRIQDDLVLDNLLYQPLRIDFTRADSSRGTVVIPPKGRAIIENARVGTLAANVGQVLVPQGSLRIRPRGLAPQTPQPVYVTWIVGAAAAQAVLTGTVGRSDSFGGVAAVVATLDGTVVAAAVAGGTVAPTLSLPGLARAAAQVTGTAAATATLTGTLDYTPAADPCSGCSGGNQGAVSGIPVGSVNYNGDYTLSSFNACDPGVSPAMWHYQIAIRNPAFPPTPPPDFFGDMEVLYGTGVFSITVVAGSYNYVNSNAAGISCVGGILTGTTTATDTSGHGGGTITIVFS